MRNGETHRAVVAFALLPYHSILAVRIIRVLPRLSAIPCVDLILWHRDPKSQTVVELGRLQTVFFVRDIQKKFLSSSTIRRELDPAVCSHSVLFLVVLKADIVVLLGGVGSWTPTSIHREGQGEGVRN